MKISKTERIDWLDNFADRIAKVSSDPRTAVEAARTRDQQSIMDQISSIMSGKATSANSVESKIQDMQERTGLKEYLRRMKSAQEHSEDMSKIDRLPESFADLPESTQNDVQNYVKNLIETHHGNIHIPAIQESVIQTFRLKGVHPKHINDQAFEKYISDCILDQKKKHPSFEEHNSNLGRGVGLDGEIDPENNDFFSSLMPVKM